MKAYTLVLSITVLGLAACTQTGTPPGPGGGQPPVAERPAPPQASPGRTCDVSLIDRIGDPISSVSVPSGANYRVVRQDDIITTDFLETRTNIGLNTDETIKSVYCG